MKLWSPRFSGEMKQDVFAFNASLKIDGRLFKEDITGSLAHCRELMRIGVLTREEGQITQTALVKLMKALDLGLMEFSPESEDIHMAIESLLIAEIGDLGKKLHTGRSRNDQVALDLRLYIKKAVPETQSFVKKLMTALQIQATQNAHVIMPGFTHLMGAQPITFGYHLLTYEHMLSRDYKRLDYVFDAADTMPLGSGALAGSNYPIDRQRLASDLDFGKLAEHAMDAVSDRDYILDYLYANAMIMQHLSRLCEEMILWSSTGFGFVRISDAYCTGSSIMPQKRNPDTLELIRGKTGRVYGHLNQMLTLMKGLPLAYNKDMQEDKESLFDSIDTVNACLSMMAGVIEGLKANAEAMKVSVDKGYLNATELADYLVEKGLPFRDAHHVTGRIVLEAEKAQKTLMSLSLEDYQQYSPLFEADVYTVLDYEHAVNRKKTIGSTSFNSVNLMLSDMEDLINRLG